MKKILGGALLGLLVWVGSADAGTKINTNVTSGNAPLTVRFTADAFANSWTDPSTGNTIAIADRGERYISFGDGSSNVKLQCNNPTASTCQAQVTHTYTNTGTYTATLFTAGYYGIQNDSIYGTRINVESISITVGGGGTTTTTTNNNGTYASCTDARNNGNYNSGIYTITGIGNAYCNMTRDGGGWLRITPAIARTQLGGSLVIRDGVGNTTTGFDADRPYTQDGTGGHTAQYTFRLPFEVREFFFQDYEARSNAVTDDSSDIYPSRFRQTSWSSAHGSSVGDISFGFANDSGPLTSLARVIGTDTLFPGGRRVQWPAGTQIYQAHNNARDFRISWGDEGAPSEGWYPWWSGSIMVRGERPRVYTIPQNPIPTVNPTPNPVPVSTLTIIAPRNDATVKEHNVSIIGTGTPGSTIQVSAVGKSCSARVLQGGGWTCTLTLLPAGTYTVVATQYGASGGAATGTATTNFTILGKQCPVFTQYHKPGQSGGEIPKIQEFLREQGYYRGAINGYYDYGTDQAIRAFQQEFKTLILDPWRLPAPTGNWYKTSRKHANFLSGCYETVYLEDIGITY